MWSNLILKNMEKDVHMYVGFKIIIRKEITYRTFKQKQH